MNQRIAHKAITTVGLGSMLVGAAVLIGAFPGGAGAAPDQVQSTTSTSVVSGENPTCDDLGDFEFEFKIDEQPVEGTTYTDPDTGFSVTITDVTEGNPMTFSFTTNTPVSAVFVKAGNGGIVYLFDPPTTVGTGLASPKDSISHVSFCWNGPPTTTSSSSSSTSSSTSSTTSSTTSTTVMGSTSTTAGGSTTTMQAVTTTTPPGGGLPRTGSDTGPLVVLATGLLAGGIALIAATRRFGRS